MNKTLRRTQPQRTRNKQPLSPKPKRAKIKATPRRLVTTQARKTNRQPTSLSQPYAQSKRSFAIVTFTVEGPGGYKKDITSPTGRGLRQVLQASKVEMLPSICNGQLQCSTCHVKLPPRLYKATGEPDEAEMDILSIAADTQFNSSRLACQMAVTPAFDGCTITIPEHFINHMDDPTGTPLPTRSLMFDDV